MGGRIALLLATCMALSQGLTISLLSQSVLDSPSRLRYQGGDCTWRITGLFGAQDVILTGPHIDLESLDTGVGIICEVNGTVLLQAVIFDHDVVPPPQNVTLDTVNKKLHWDHPFLPQLPPHFELSYAFTMTYQVYGKKDGVNMPSLSGLVPNDYFDLTSESDYCAEYDFVVQTLIANISHEHPVQNSSSVSGYLSVVPSFRNLSAVAKRDDEFYLHIHVNFELEEEDCPGTHPTFFIVNLKRIGEHKLDINSKHIDDREGLFHIRLTDPVPNTCHLEGTIFGGNDAGNCTVCEIQFSTRSECNSVVMPAETSSTAVGPPVDPFSSPFPPPDKNMLAYVIGAVAGGSILFITVIVLGMAIALVCIKHPRTGHHLDPTMQTNQAYVTVVRSSGKIKTQPCPAYELAVIET